jgi:hypothetical protein
VNVRLIGLSGEVNITLYDMVGQVILKETLQIIPGETRVSTLEMITLSPGLYQLEVIGEGLKKNFEIIKN